MPRTTRDRVYTAINSERDYQDALAANMTGDSQGQHPVASFILFMETYLHKAKAVASTDWSDRCDERTLEHIRKVVALGVSCMEQHGAPMRVMPTSTVISARAS